MLFLTTGVMGYTLSKHARSVAGTAWSESVMGSQVAVGLVSGLLAACFWTRGLRTLAQASPRGDGPDGGERRRAGF